LTELANDPTASAVHDCTDGKRHLVRHIALNEKQEQQCQKTDLASIDIKERPCLERFSRKLELFDEVLRYDIVVVKSIEEIVEDNEKMEREGTKMEETKMEDNDERASRDDIRPTLKPERTAGEDEELTNIGGHSVRINQPKATMGHSDSLVCVNRPSYQQVLAQGLAMQQPISLCITETPHSLEVTSLDLLAYPAVNLRSIAETILPKNLVLSMYSYTALGYPSGNVKDLVTKNKEGTSMQQLVRSSNHSTGLIPLVAPFVPGSRFEASTIDQNSSNQPNIVRERQSGGKRDRGRRR
jgi:hypothetical protein